MGHGACVSRLSPELLAASGSFGIGDRGTVGTVDRLRFQNGWNGFFSPLAPKPSAYKYGYEYTSSTSNQ